MKNVIFQIGKQISTQNKLTICGKVLGSSSVSVLKILGGGGVAEAGTFGAFSMETAPAAVAKRGELKAGTASPFALLLDAGRAAVVAVAVDGEDIVVTGLSAWLPEAVRLSGSGIDIKASLATTLDSFSLPEGFPSDMIKADGSRSPVAS
jgi:hypothetical protein